MHPLQEFTFLHVFASPREAPCVNWPGLDGRYLTSPEAAAPAPEQLSCTFPHMVLSTSPQVLMFRSSCPVHSVSLFLGSVQILWVCLLLTPKNAGAV